VTEGDNRYPIHCNVVSDNVVQCTVSRATAGKNVVLHVGEFIFWTFVPEAVPPRETASAAPSQYCYNVYDLVEIPRFAGWLDINDVCQTSPANVGDRLLNYAGYYGNYNFIFLPQSPPFCAQVGVTENAYYREICGN
jgi:hypothetical protein